MKRRADPKIDCFYAGVEFVSKFTGWSIEESQAWLEANAEPAGYDGLWLVGGKKLPNAR